MDKGIFKSKTMWGFGVAALIALGGAFGIGTESTIAEVVQILSVLFGVYGVRDAL